MGDIEGEKERKNRGKGEGRGPVAAQRLKTKSERWAGGCRRTRRQKGREWRGAYPVLSLSTLGAARRGMRACQAPGALVGDNTLIENLTSQFDVGARADDEEEHADE
jgi:hypothetical protein